VPHPWEPGQYAAESVTAAWMFAAEARVLHEVGYAEDAHRGSPSPYEVSTHAAHAEFTSVLRDTFGNPFRPALFESAWRTEAVVGLARGMYESRDFAPMPVLADALEDAGCAEEGVLAHCRGRGPHARGCFLVDVVLGKS
jgi:hypothetical protein